MMLSLNKKLLLACIYLSTTSINAKAKFSDQEHQHQATKVYNPGKVDDHNSYNDDNATISGKNGRAALFSEPRIFPFLEHIFNPPAPVVEPSPAPIGGVNYNPYYGPYHPSPQPDCALNGMYCLYNNGYPSDKVNTIINRYYDEVRVMYSSLHRVPVADLMYYDNRTHSYREGGHFVCGSDVQYIRPGWARSIRGEWLAIVNTDHFPQTVRVEECKYAKRRCEFLPPCYKSTCVQRFSFHRLLAVDPVRPAGRPFVEVFEIPSACSCFVENFVYY